MLRHVSTAQLNYCIYELKKHKLILLSCWPLPIQHLAPNVGPQMLYIWIKEAHTDSSILLALLDQKPNTELWVASGQLVFQGRLPLSSSTWRTGQSSSHNRITLNLPSYETTPRHRKGNPGCSSVHALIRLAQCSLSSTVCEMWGAQEKLWFFCKCLI